MLEKIQNVLANENEMSSRTLRLLSLIFLLIAGGMSFFEYTKHGFLFSKSFTFAPGFISTLIAIVMIAPLYLRTVLKWNNSIFSLISLILILMVFASFIELALGGNKNSSLIYGLIGVSIVLSWLGLRSAAGSSWILVLIAAIYSAVTNNLAMGFYGFIYVASGFIGLVLHSGLTPAELFYEIKSEYSHSSQTLARKAKEDISSTVDHL